MLNVGRETAGGRRRLIAQCWLGPVSRLSGSAREEKRQATNGGRWKRIQEDNARYQLIARATYLPKGNLVAAASYLADSVALKRKRAGVFMEGQTDYNSPASCKTALLVLVDNLKRNSES